MNSRIIDLFNIIQVFFFFYGTKLLQVRVKYKLQVTIHLIPKWWPINYSFVCMLISPLRLFNMYKKQKSSEVKMRQRGLINMQTKE